jgi:DNA (cytosine-5)-methyltransferase 1
MLKPDWIVLENVTGLLETAEGQFQIIIASEFEAIDYTYAVWTLSAIDFGVPQKRSRVFFVGRRKGEIPPAPQPTTRKPVLVREAICDLPQLLPGANTDVLKYLTPASSKYAKTMRRSLRSCSGHLVSANNDTVIRRYAYIPQGGNWCDIPTRLMKNYSDLKNKRSRHTGIYHRLSWDKPSTVIANYRKNMLIHPDQDRGLSVREAARLQSFPDHYNFCGSIGFQQQQVGNAVPPLLAKAVFDQIINFL